MQEVADALIEFAKNALLVLGVLLLAWIITEVIEAIIVILATPVLVLASAGSPATPSSTGGNAPADQTGTTSADMTEEVTA